MKCPHCGKEIPDGSHYCLHCMKSLQVERVYTPSPAKKRSRLVWLLPIAAAAALGVYVTVYFTGNHQPEEVQTAAESLQSSEAESSSSSENSYGEYVEGETGGRYFQPNSDAEEKPVFDIEDGVLTRYSGTNSVVEIPEEVTAIGESVFWNDQNLTEVILPEGLTEIRTSAFAGCTRLSKVNIPASVSSIESQAFTTCTSLKEFTVSPDSPYFMAQDGILYSADGSILNCYPSGKVQTGFVIPETVTMVYDWEFEGNPYLETIDVPKSVSYQFCSFGHCQSLKEIRVSEENADFCSIDGVFYSKDGKTLIYYPAGRTETEFEIPQQVEAMEFNAFLQNRNLVSVTVPEGVSELKVFVFKEAEKLQELHLPSTITAIDPVAFWNIQTTPTIYTPSNSVTESYCEENGFPCVVDTE